MPPPMVLGAVKLPTELITFLEKILARAELNGCFVTSVARDSKAQATAMLGNCMRTGVDVQYRTYLPAGDAVIKVAEDNWALVTTATGRAKLIEMMTQRIEDIGPEKVSHHCLPMGSGLIVADIRKNSVLNHARFQQAILGD